jgi:hypothetical protein
MSQRLGMADGRCFTINTSSRLLNNYIMTNNGVDYVDNYKYRQLLQKKGPELIDTVTNEQKVAEDGACQRCDKPLLKVAGIY